MTPLPPPPSRPTGMPTRRRKSAIRTANASVQEQFLERVRAVAADPLLLLPQVVGDEPAVLARLRRTLAKAKEGGLPFTARFDKGILGAVRTVRQVAKLQAAPRLLDARVDGNRRFFLQHGQARRLVNLGVQNWDDPLCLMLAYGPIAPKHGLHFFAGSLLWCTGTAPRPPAQWYADLAERAGVTLTEDAEGAVCPHGDQPRIEMRFRGAKGAAPRILVCGGCGATSSGEGINNLHGHVLNRYLSDHPSRPAEVTARLPDGTVLPVADRLVNAYRTGKATEGDLLESAAKEWRGQAQEGAGRFVLGARDFGSDQEAFLGALDLADWERAPVRILTAGGHVGESTATSDVLASHRAHLEAAVESLLGPGEGRAFLARHASSEVRTILRLAREESDRRAKTRDLPDIEGLGPLGAWIDGLAREARTVARPELLRRVRREAASTRDPAHFFAFLVALGLEGEGTRYTTHDQKEAGRHWAPLAKAVLEATGPAYRDAVLAYLRETGAGENA